VTKILALPAGALFGVTPVIVNGMGVPVIAIDRLRGAEVLPALSVTVTLKLKGLPVALVGIPSIVPVVA
jgi:hypothetical protein